MPRDDFTDEVCFFSSLGDCDGRLEAAHLIAKQRIRREFKGNLDADQLARLVWHPSCWRPMCSRHHRLFDQRIVRLERCRVPPDVEAFARAWNLGWSLAADFGSS